MAKISKGILGAMLMEDWFEDASHDILVSEAPKVQQIIISEISEK